MQNIIPNKALRYIINETPYATKWLDGMKELYSYNTIKKYLSSNNTNFKPTFMTLQELCSHSGINLLDFLLLSEKEIDNFKFKNLDNYENYCPTSSLKQKLKLYFEINPIISIKPLIENLIQERKRQILTQTNLANTLNQSKQRISQFENNYKKNNSYKLTTLIKYANALGFPFETFILDTFIILEK